MFGYVKINKQELLVKDYETYRGIYCGLCKSLGQNYTVFSRLFLNYDFTFYALLLMALDETEPSFGQEGCLFNPLCRKKCCHKNSAIDRAADALMITTYFKLTDDVSDSRFLKKAGYRFLRFLFRPMSNKAKKRAPDVWELLSVYMERQREAEQATDEFVDRASEPTARLMEELFSLSASDERTKRILRVLGYHIGKWIYLIDAADDRKKDAKSGSFNPLLLEYGDDCLARIEPILNICINEAAKALDLLSFGRFEMILKNVIYVGLPCEQARILSKKEETK